MAWTRFPPSWPFVRGIYRSPVATFHKNQFCGVLGFLWCWPEHIVDTNVTLWVIWNVTALMWSQCSKYRPSSVICKANLTVISHPARVGITHFDVKMTLSHNVEMKPTSFTQRYCRFRSCIMAIHVFSYINMQQSFHKCVCIICAVYKYMTFMFKNKHRKYTGFYIVWNIFAKPSTFPAFYE